jgi:eukaryotic-like serine/threonine-protein kinase
MMVQRIDDHDPPPDQDSSLDPVDDDERVGEAIEAYLALAEQGSAPEIEEFAARYPELKDDVRAGLEGLELVHGLLGLGSAHGSGSGRGSGADPRIESGHRIAGYRVVRELGRGGMGTVYEAVHMGLGRPVALKVLGIHAAPDTSARRRFLNEARTAAGLHHTHIVPVFDVGQVGGLCYYAMQRIEGSGLDLVVRHLRRSRPPMPGGGGGPASGRFTVRDTQSASSPSSLNTGLGQLWARVSSRWPLKRPNTENGKVHGQGTDPATALSPSILTGQPGIIGSVPARSSSGDSTASWTHGGRQTHSDGNRFTGDLGSGALVVSGSQGSLAAIDPATRSSGDQPVPFDPPRGSAYFRWVAEVGRQSADALAHAHHQGVIHRDVKPSNLLIDGKGNIWVTDFGLARRLADPGLTQHDSLLGTPRYMSPEQARTGSIDGRTDIYSLGATLYELLTLRPPFDGRSAAELIEQIGQQEPAPPSTIDPRVPRDLETIVLKALAKRPADRYLTATEIAEDLGRYLNHEPVKARRISPAGRLWRVARRHPGITSVTTVAAALVLAIATFAYVRVVAARDKAILAGEAAEQALSRAKESNQKERAEMKQRLVKTVEGLGRSDAPNRRAHGLDAIRETVSLDPDAELRGKLRDEAVKFLVLREVEAQSPELATGRARGLVFGPTGHRLAVLSEDDDELTFWDVAHQQRKNPPLSLRIGPSMISSPGESALNENANGDRPDTSQTAAPGSSTNRNAPSLSLTAAAARRSPSWFTSQRVALVGQSIAAILPDERGVALFDPLVPGAPPRFLIPADRTVLGVFGDPAGRRLVTIEQNIDDAIGLTDGFNTDEPLMPHEFLVNLWDPDHLDERPIRLQWTRTRPQGMPPFPLVAISPDGTTVAVAANRTTYVRLFSGLDGKIIGRPEGRSDGRPGGRPDGRNEGRAERNDIDTQTQLSALALGPNDSLATAGTTPLGVVIKIWNLAATGPNTVPTSFPTLIQNYTRLMRFNPKGTLLAIAGAGPIELWDPLAHDLLAVLRMNDQATDLAFAPDGRTLAAGGRSAVTSVWTVHDSAARTQLSGFNSASSSLAFGPGGVLAGVGWGGDVWFWRDGRCPEFGPPLPQNAGPNVSSTSSGPEPKRPEAPGRDPVRKGERPRDGARPRMGGERSARPTLAFDDSGRLFAHDSRTLRIWPADLTEPQTPPSFRQAWPDTPGFGPWRMPCMAKTIDGRTMVFVRSPGVFLWNSQAEDKVTPVIPPPGWAADPGVSTAKGVRAASPGALDATAPPIRAVQIAPDGDRIYMLEQNRGQGNRVHVWAIEKAGSSSPAQAHDLNWSLPVSEGAISIALRGDGSILALGDRTGIVSLIDTRARRVVGTIRPVSADSENNWLAMAFSPDGQNLAIGSPEGVISVWSVAQPRKPRLRFHLPGHRGAITCLVFDALNNRLASSGTEPRVEVWDLELIERELARLGLSD